MKNKSHNVYQSKVGLLPGTSFREIMAAARREYHIAQKRTPRRVAHVRSAYFAKDKIFINTFWNHLGQKHPADQMRRLKLYRAALDLVRYSKMTPDTVFSKDDMNSIMHRFYGVTSDGHYYTVQIKQNKRTNRKDFISVFPSKKP